jgi:hypothetical protein
MRLRRTKYQRRHRRRVQPVWRADGQTLNRRLAVEMGITSRLGRLRSFASITGSVSSRPQQLGGLHLDQGRGLPGSPRKAPGRNRNLPDGVPAIRDQRDESKSSGPVAERTEMTNQRSLDRHCCDQSDESHRQQSGEVLSLTPIANKRACCETTRSQVSRSFYWAGFYGSANRLIDQECPVAMNLAMSKPKCRGEPG